jgi:GT2 family glycosyltransferase
MRVGAILVTFSHYPAELFSSLEKTNHNVTWYVHHHGQDPELEDKLEQFSKTADVDLNLHRVNRGLSRSWNDGLERSFAAGNDFTLLLNDDLFFYEDGFDRFIDRLKEDPGFGIIEAHGFETQSRTVSHQGAACCAIGARVLDTIGYFDENITPAYCEDTDYWLRARKAGVPVVEDPRVLVEHDRSRTYRSARPDLRRRIIGAHDANKAYFIRKWGALWEHGMEDIKFDVPFNDPRFGLKIGPDSRSAPYGSLYDRKDGQFSWNMAHVRERGDLWSSPGQWCGAPGGGQWIEGVLLTGGAELPAADLEYSALLEPDQFSDWARCGEYLGSRGRSAPLRGLRLRLANASAATHALFGASTFVGGGNSAPAPGPELVFMIDDRRPIESFWFGIKRTG